MSLSALSFDFQHHNRPKSLEPAHTQDSRLQDSQHSSTTSNKNVIGLQQEESVFLTFDDRFSVGGHKNADLKPEYLIIPLCQVKISTHSCV